METEEKVLVLRRIHVHYRLRAGTEHHEAVARVHGMHHRFCPVYRSLQPAIAITTSIELV